jgi:ATP-dependent Clp protease ATP-binding subunit ClpA
MTTNAGAREMSGGDIGFARPTVEQSNDDSAPGDDRAADNGQDSSGEPSRKSLSHSLNQASKLHDPVGKGKSALERTFSPEFRNRLDQSVVFNHLARREILRVVDKFVKEVQLQLVEKNVSLELTEAARQWFATKGFDKVFGARPMSRLVQQKIREPLAEELLFGKLQDGGTVKIDVKDGELEHSYEKHVAGCESDPQAIPDAVPA